MTRRWLMALFGSVMLGKKQISAGCRVRIVGGALKGIFGKYVRYDGKKHVVEIVLINRPILVKLGAGIVERVPYLRGAEATGWQRAAI